MDPALLRLLAFVLVGLYAFLLFGLALFGAHRYWLVHRYFRSPHGAPPPAAPPGVLPRVLVQLPIYNERFVAPRLLQAVGRLDYPSDRLEIQILDDSDDATSEVVALEAARLRAHGLNVDHIRRPNRDSFKAGALACGLARSSAEFVAVFDADFVPPSDFLLRTLGDFADPAVGLVQTRWGHLNGDSSLLTRIQALMLDGHFIIDHGARARAGCFFNFNGTAGVWRRAAIDSAGGWSHDTVTEDLDLSYRAQLAGWKFVFRPEIESPAELPVHLSALKSQQHRWTKGASQTARKLLPSVWRAPLALPCKVEATFHLLANLPYVLMVGLALLLLPVYWIRHRLALDAIRWIDLPMLAAGTFALASFYANAVRELGRSPWLAILRLPALMALGIGLSLNNAWACIEGFARGGGEFVRTPKYGLGAPRDAWQARTYRPRRQRWIPVLEGLLLLYLLVTGAYALHAGLWWTLPFLALFTAGYAYVFVQSLRAPVAARDARSSPRFDPRGAT